MKTREDILRKIKTQQLCIDKESMQRMEIERSKKYQAVQIDIDSTDATIRELMEEKLALQDRQREMLAAVSDSRPALLQAKQEIMDLMQLEGVEGYAEDWISVAGKWSEKRGVDGRRLLDVLGGDIDEFVSIVKPSQKAIKDYAAEHENMKRPLLQCIRLESRELVDVDISLPEA